MQKATYRLMAPAVAAAAFAAVGAGMPAFAAPVTVSASHHTDRVVGHVYEATNDSAGNAVQVFDRTADGRLTAAETVPTGGLGHGTSLASQYAMVREGNLLFVVNGGDNTLSTLAITRKGLVARDVAPTGGQLPVSVTVRGGLVYVLNQGSETISGLRVSPSGDLVNLPGSTRALSKNSSAAATAAAEVAFTPDGRSLVVTHKGDQAIDTFAVHGAYAGAAVRSDSSGVTPYGFDFDRRGDAIVSEAGSGAVSSYRVKRDGLEVISASVPDTQNAACWLVVTRDGRFAYAVNAASASISSYRIGRDGELTLLSAVAATTTAGGTDAALTPDDSSLHVRLGNGSVASYAVSRDGSLTFLNDAAGAAHSGVAGITAD